MPILDLPLAELEKYPGMNPRPMDHDEYWARALAELESTDPAPRLEKASFEAPGVECFHLWFTGVGGARIHAKYLRPAQRSAPCPAVLHFHGYTGSSGDWQDKLALAMAGRVVAAMDCRGQGGLSSDPGGAIGRTHGGLVTRGLTDHEDKLYYRGVFLDTAQLARAVAAIGDADTGDFRSTGGSQGGALALVCAALSPIPIRRVASRFHFLSDYRRVWSQDQAQNAYEDLRSYFRLFDPGHQREEEIFAKLGYIDVQFLAPRITGEVLAACALSDPICLPSSQYAAYNKMTCQKTICIYPDFAHEHLPGFEDEAFRFLIGYSISR